MLSNLFLTLLAAEMVGFWLFFFHINKLDTLKEMQRIELIELRQGFEQRIPSKWLFFDGEGQF
jgi:hypothetical protein